MPLEKATTFADSLRFIRVERVTISVRTENMAKWHTRAEFRHAGELYNLSVTDCEIEQRAYASPKAVAEIEDAFLTISLGEPFHNYCYKLVAAIIAPFPI